jgi:hypothetical protein
MNTLTPVTLPAKTLATSAAAGVTPVTPTVSGRNIILATRDGVAIPTTLGFPVSLVARVNTSTCLPITLTDATLVCRLCRKCAGTGLVDWERDGGVCYRCDGTGHSGAPVALGSIIRKETLAALARGRKDARDAAAAAAEYAARVAAEAAEAAALAARVAAAVATADTLRETYVAGAKVTVTATVGYVKFLTQWFGYRETTTAMILLTAEDGTQFKIFTGAGTKAADALTKGTTATITATVKNVDTWEDRVSVVLTRPKVTA